MQKYFSHFASFKFSFFSNFTPKTKIGIANRWKPRPIKLLANLKQGVVNKFDMVVFRLF
jgi:hypothetical protein